MRILSMEKKVDRFCEIIKLNRSRYFQRFSNSVEEKKIGQKRRSVDKLEEETINNRSAKGEKTITGGRAD